MNTSQYENVISIPKCEKCGFGQEHLLDVNTHIFKLTYECVECGWRQTVIVE